MRVTSGPDAVAMRCESLNVLLPLSLSPSRFTYVTIASLRVAAKRFAALFLRQRHLHRTGEIADEIAEIIRAELG